MKIEKKKSEIILDSFIFRPGFITAYFEIWPIHKVMKLDNFEIFYALNPSRSKISFIMDFFGSEPF